MSGATAVASTPECSHTAAGADDGEPIRIGELARRSGVSVRSLRYYEQQRLLEADRTAGGQRVYAPAAVERVRFIQRLYAAGMPSRAIVELLPCFSTGRATASMVERMERERDGIAVRIRELAAARDRLEEAIAVTRRYEEDDAGEPLARTT